MENEFSVIGHGWKRCFFYSDGKNFNNEYVNAGVAWLSELLKLEKIELDDDYKCEFIELCSFNKDLKSKEKTFRVSRNLGFTKGEKDIIEKTSNNYIVWDEGFSEITPPKYGYILWTSKVKIPSFKQMEAMKDRTVLILDVNALRNEGVMISKQISWEKTVLDLVKQIQLNEKINHLIMAKNIFIVFDYDGYVMLKREMGIINMKLYLINGYLEGTITKKYIGYVPDAWGTIIFKASKEFILAIDNNQNFEDILLGSLDCAEEVLHTGYGNLGITESLNKILNSFKVQNFSNPYFMGMKNFALDENDSNDGEINENNFSLVASITNGSILEHARNMVMSGNIAIKEFPKLSLGSFTTIDRKEIENYQNINNLILEYVKNDNIKPLSIAVFGTPGSGKSFGVSQIAQSISCKIKKLEFNVSQFVDESNLSSAFQMVRDEVLNGKIPLVFFDEFDSEKNGATLGWLKNFLMPMQDGKFMLNEGEHPIGKSIFVFAGGTSSTFIDFSSPKDEDKRKEFIKVKGPDFVSRLRGTIDVLGPNPSDENDYSYILRRALLLRSLCERKLKPCFEDNIFHIDDGILNAMLLIKEYKHGARSMESIIDMSRTNDLTQWNSTSLPSDSQLSIHVDAKKFMNIVLNDMNMQAMNMFLSKVIYEYYNGSNGETEINSICFEDYFKQEDLLKLSKSINLMLSSIKCSFDRGDFSLPTVESFTEEEIKIMDNVEVDDDNLLKAIDIIPILKKIKARVYRLI